VVFSRFWYLVLGVAVAGALFIAYVGAGVTNHAEERGAARTLNASSVAVSLYLKDDATRRANALVPLAINGDVGEALKKAYGTDTVKEVDGPLREKAGAALRKFREQAQDFTRFDALWAIDVHGRVVASDNFEKATGAEGFEMGGYPVVADALHGYVRDDTWLFGEDLWRIVARPVELEAGAAPVGAIVAGKKVDDTFARDIVEHTGAALVFHAAGRSVIKATPPSSDTHLVGLTPEDLAKLDKLPTDDSYKVDGRSKPMLVKEEAAYDVRAVFVRLPGEAWDLGAGFATMVQHPRLGSPLDVYAMATSEERGRVPLALLAVVALVAAVVGAALTAFELGAPLAGFRRGLAELADRTNKVDVMKPSTYRGPYKQLAALVNDALDKVASIAGVDRGPADLQRVLGPLPTEPTMSAFAVKEAPRPAVAVPAPAKPVVAAAKPVVAAAKPVVAAAKPVVVAGKSEEIPAAKQAPSAAPAEEPQEPSESEPTSLASERPADADHAVTVPVGESMRPEDDGADGEPGGDDEDATAIASSGSGGAGLLDEETEWRGVYEEFVDLKKQLGESVDKLTYEKFRGTLQRNKDALVARHGCERVSFKVYEKQGRAALKASPVK